MRDAYEYSVAVAHHVENIRKRLAESSQSLIEKQRAADELTDKRNQAATDLAVTAWAQNLDTLKSGLSEYRAALSGLSSAVESASELRTAFDVIWTHLEEATAREARQKEIYDELERRAAAAEIARDAAGRAAGGDVAETLKRVARAREGLEQLRIEEKELRTRYHDTEVAVTRVDERLRNRTEMLNGQTDRRESAAASLLTFVSTGLLRLAAGLHSADELASSTTRTVELAFELKSRLDLMDASDSVWETHQKAIPSAFNKLMQILSAQNCRSSAIFRDDVFVATAAFAGKERPVHELQEVLFEDVETRQKLLRAREREILENHLIGHVSHHLHDLLHAAEEQVRQMNAELESRPTSTGMKLRFVWRPVEHGPEGLAEARQRLMQSNSEWTATERQMLGAFFQRQIQDVCSGIEGASWQESLSEALDYRKWHWFGVERYQDSVWKRLTRRTHGTGSGGEKAVALTLPHFAAAAAFYRSAHSLAPRLILLDEAFVGIDADMRAKCMGLIDAFDLDFMMTSEREWGCYQTLPALAIYQLSTRPGIDAVGLTRWVWNGRQRSLAQQKTEQENLCAANVLT
jgi:hypothetical protein